ncbi:MAG: hypothetical protein CMJ48_01350 [Planctomycetaceae bacterium]|nr:hypothetical protein [Planctomycetaceae bacterium]
MNRLTIAYKSIRQRFLASSLTALSVALGVTLMVAVLVIHGIMDDMFSQTATGYDLIVGPQGSKIQLVLNSVYRISQPIENMPYKYYRKIADDHRVASALPLALGDTTEEGGFPILGTVPRYFTTPYMPNKKFRLRGELIRNHFDAIIGSHVAAANGWDVGSQFRMVHGGMDDGDHVHDELFTIVGVLKQTGTPNDKTVFVHLDGFYLIDGHDKPLLEAIERERAFMLKPPLTDEQRAEVQAQADKAAAVHSHEITESQKEVTAILLTMKGDNVAERSMRAISLQNELKEGNQAQAVNPVRQMRWLMDNIVGNVRVVLVVLTSLIIAVSSVSIFVSIYNSMADRKREIAIMRALGASRTTVLTIVLSESILLCLCGGVLGILLGHGLVFAAAPIVQARSGLLLDPFAFEQVELVLLPALIVLASLVGFIPGLTAYRTDVAQTLAE